MPLRFSVGKPEYSPVAHSVLLFARDGGRGVAFGVGGDTLRELELRPLRLTPLAQERAVRRHRARLEAAAAAAYAAGRAPGEQYCIWIRPQDV